MREQILLMFLVLVILNEGAYLPKCQCSPETKQY